MERFRNIFSIGRFWRFWIYLDPEVRIVFIGMLIMLLVSFVILVANLIY
jgi:hypothetical protein